MSQFRGPLFIVGMPRSGTKLLRELLRQHPQIGIPDFETECLPRWAADDPGDFEAFYRRATRSLYFQYMKRDGRLISRQKWLQTAPNSSIAGLFEGLCRHDAAQPEGIWGDKSPGYRSQLLLLRDIFPEARVIHIVRDARDVCLSTYQTWGKRMSRTAQRWQDDVSRCRQQGVSLGGDYLEVRYEDLIAVPESTLRRICALCEVDFSPRMLSPGRATEDRGLLRGATRIRADSCGRWRQELDRSTVRKIEQLCGPMLDALGYPRCYPDALTRRASSLQLQICAGWDAVQIFRHRAAEWGLRDAARISLQASQAGAFRAGR